MSLSAAAVLAAAVLAASSVELPATVQPGQLVVGRLPAGTSAHCRLAAGDRELRIAPDGRFVFGVARDARGSVEVSIAADPGCPLAGQAQTVAVAAREFPVEHIDGLPQQTVTPAPAIAARIAREQAAVAAARERDDPRTDFADGFLRPVDGRISGVYGSRRILNGVPKNPHYGLDVAAPAGTPVRAPAAGIVSFAETALYLTGGTVLIDHGHGLSSSFLHMSRLDVGPGQRVEAGEVIGAVGATGRASGPHLHWGFNWFDVRLDPALLPAPAASGRD
ncbi:MAG TPA: M23 family metallopeptidase [Xanthomonadaceae bacterium]|nr:M23 family metallopeptidase [Xanthomonadaceae bacterium]